MGGAEDKIVIYRIVFLKENISEEQGSRKLRGL